MPSFEDEALQLEFILPKRTCQRMTDDLAPSVLMKNNKLSKPRDSDADIANGKASPDSCETSKDRGSEKWREWRGSEATEPDDLTAVYYAETVDFPDSPLHLKLLKKRNREAQGLDTEDDEEEESTTISIMGRGHHRSNRPPRERATPDRLPDSRRKITVNPDLLTSDAVGDEDLSFSRFDDLDTPDDLDDDPFDVLTEEGREDSHSWKPCVVAGEERRIDMKVIEPYKKVLSHGGYIGSSNLAIIVFSACYLPDRSRIDYDYVMDNLFLYVLTTLAQLVAENYVLVYLHGATLRSCMPSFSWLKRCYQMIDRRLRKNLKGLYLVHPTFWLKTIVIMTKPFISSKFSRKLRFVNNLQELEDLIPMDHVCIPDKVKEFDERRILEA